jgi:N-acetylglutamate synthase-like GNAT family acetyltransferase
VTTDLDDIDLDVVHRWLSEEAYWALGRSREVVEAAARASVNFGALDADGRLVGYARVVTDQVSFAWLCDVFVDPAARGVGAGKALAGAVVAAVRPMGLQRVMLATADAHELYRRFGFEGVTDPEKLMTLTWQADQRGGVQDAV